MSVTTQSAPLTASSGSVPTRISAPDDLYPFEKRLLRRQLRRGGDAQAELEPLGGLHPRREHVVGVAGPGHGAAADRAAMLLEGHDVGHHLARMRAPGQAVDHRNRGIARQLGERLGVERADHDGVDVARQHARGVGERLAAAELHFLRRQQNGIAAELAHGDLERDAGARRRPLEDHRQRLAGERPVGAAALRLHGARRFDDLAQVGGRKSMRSRKWRMPLIRPPPAFASWHRPGSSCAQARSRRADALGDFLLADDQRRQQPHHVVAGGDRDHLLGAQRVDQFAGRNERAQADQQPFAAHLGDQRRIAVLDLGKPLLEEQRGVLARGRRSRAPA